MTMKPNDRELLELAAKAAGMPAGDYCTPNHEPALYHGDYGFWQPLTDDGDALRLAVKLNILDSPLVAHHIAVGMFTRNQDRLTATRLAFVLAAAGKMKQDT